VKFIWFIKGQQISECPFGKQKNNNIFVSISALAFKNRSNKK
jgi:hypothetical protein